MHVIPLPPVNSPRSFEEPSPKRNVYETCWGASYTISRRCSPPLKGRESTLVSMLACHAFDEVRNKATLAKKCDENIMQLAVP